MTAGDTPDTDLDAVDLQRRNALALAAEARALFVPADVVRARFGYPPTPTEPEPRP